MKHHAAIHDRGAPARARKTTATPLPVNLEAIRWLEEWGETPPSRDDVFWRRFDREIRSNRMTFRRST